MQKMQEKNTNVYTLFNHSTIRRNGGEADSDMSISFPLLYIYISLLLLFIYLRLTSFKIDIIDKILIINKLRYIKRYTTATIIYHNKQKKEGTRKSPLFKHMLNPIYSCPQQTK